MPGILEELTEMIRQQGQLLAELAAQVRERPQPLCPLKADEEVWADGPLTVEESCEFLKVSRSMVFRLVAIGDLVSANNGRRLIAKRGCIRYLVKHQEHRDGTDDATHAG